MKKLLTFVVALLSFVYVSGQKNYTIRNYNYTPSLDETSGGIWGSWEREPNDSISYSGHPDSIFITYAGYPDFGDLYVPDNEVKMKALWHNDSVYFLFQRLDDLFVTGKTESGDIDTSIADGFDNLDATKLYFYLNSDSSRLDLNNFPDSLITWMQFVWNSDQMQAKLPSGEIVGSFGEYYTQSVQWCKDGYCYAKFGIDLKQLNRVTVDSINAQIDRLGYGIMAFLVESTENDKEITINNKYTIQTRSFWGVDIDTNATDYINKWPWLVFFKDANNYYLTPLKYKVSDFAQVYPNPASSYINIKLKQYSEAWYAIYDIMGKLILSGNFSNISAQIPIDHLNPGSYFMVIKNLDDGTIINKKILILNR